MAMAARLASRGATVTATPSTAPIAAGCRRGTCSATSASIPTRRCTPTSTRGSRGSWARVNAQTQDVGYGPYPGMIGADPAATAQDDDYEYRRSRTPVPEFVAEAVEIHLAKVYDQEVLA